MDIEQLSKSQLLLLTLLVSFVTSTATGVLTVSLLEETPQTVTQTVNRVVERTIEKVEQVDGGGAAVVTRETTVVVKEEDVLGDSVQAHAPRIVSIYSAATTTPAIASGLFLPKQGLIATGVDGVQKEDLLIAFHEGTVVSAEVVDEAENGVALLQPVLKEGQVLPKITGYEFASMENVRRGQSVFALAKKGAVETGIVSLITGANIDTNIAQSRLPYGTTLITTLGDIIGMHVKVAEGSGARFISADEIVSVLNAFTSSEEPEEENATI